jgi:hypothetical protein
MNHAPVAAIRSASSVGCKEVDVTASVLGGETMAQLMVEDICLVIKPLYCDTLPGSEGWGWKYYELSVTIIREGLDGDRQIALFNPELLGNPFCDRTDNENLSVVFERVLRTQEPAVLDSKDEANIQITAFPFSSSSQYRKIFPPFAFSSEDIMIVSTINSNTFTHAGNGLSGPSLVLWTEREELQEFCNQLIAEEVEAFSRDNSEGTLKNPLTR